MIKVAFLTTIRHNVGDDFIRDGIVYLLQKILGNFEQILIHKHEPLRPGPAVFRYPGARRLWKLLDKPRVDKYFDQINAADITIQSGAPVYWLSRSHNSTMAEWTQPFWYDRVSKIYREKPVLNIAAGSCIGLDDTVDRMLAHNGMVRFIRDIHRYCRLTTVRDTLAHELLNRLGLKNLLLPCTALFSRALYGKNSPGTYFVINYMPLGGHYSLGQPYSPKEWQAWLLELAGIAEKQHPVIWACHDLHELQATQKLGVPDDKIFYSADYRDYVKFYADCAGGVFNRIHGAMVLASYGRPSLVVGTDTRMKMAELIGIPTESVGHIREHAPREAYNRIFRDTALFEKRMQHTLAETERKYLSALRSGLNIGPKDPHHD